MCRGFGAQPWMDGESWMGWLDGGSPMEVSNSWLVFVRETPSINDKWMIWGEKKPISGNRQIYNMCVKNSPLDEIWNMWKEIKSYIDWEMFYTMFYYITISPRPFVCHLFLQWDIRNAIARWLLETKLSWWNTPAQLSDQTTPALFGTYTSSIHFHRQRFFLSSRGRFHTWPLSGAYISGGRPPKASQQVSS